MLLTTEMPLKVTGWYYFPVNTVPVPCLIPALPALRLLLRRVPRQTRDMECCIPLCTWVLKHMGLASCRVTVIQ